MTRYRKKPVEVDAMQWTGDNIDALGEWAGLTIVVYAGPNPQRVSLYTIDDVEVPCPIGHWVIREPEPHTNRFYPCDPTVFAATYERAE